MKKTKQASQEIILAYLIIVILTSLTTVASYFIGNEIKEAKVNINNQEISQKEIVEQFPDFSAYKESKKATIATSVESYVTKDFKNIGEIKETISISGKIDRLYLYLDTTVDNGKPLTSYDSIYLLLNNKGGHLRRDYSLLLPEKNPKFLFDLRQVPYIEHVPYSEARLPNFVSWMDEINNNKKVSIYGLLSTQRIGGKINEITIGYQCLGDNECSINVD